MPDQARYRVREAVLVRTATGSEWTVTFSPLETDEIGPHAGEVVIWVSPERIDAMSFGSRYTLVEVEGFRDEDHDA